MNNFVVETGLLFITMIFVTGQVFDPVFSLYHPSDVSHTDRLFAELQQSESRPFVVQANEDELDVRNNDDNDDDDNDQPLVIFEDKPRLNYENINIRKDTKNDLKVHFRFPPPRKEIQNTETSQPPRIQYGFSPLERHPLDQKTPTSKPKILKTATSSITAKEERIKSESKEIKSQTVVIRPEVTTYLPIDKLNVSETIKQGENESQLTKSETRERVLYSSEKEIYSDKQLAPPRRVQKNEYDFQFQKLPTTQAPNINRPTQTNKPNINKPLTTYIPNINKSVKTIKPNINRPVTTFVPNVYKPAKTQTKTYIIDLDSTNKYFQDAKHPTTIVITKSLPLTKKPTYAYKTIVEGRRAPSHSFAFYQAEEHPKQEQSKKPVEIKKPISSQYGYVTNFKQTTQGVRQTNYDSSYTATSPDASYYLISENSYDRNVPSPSQQKAVYQSQQAVTQPAFTINDKTGPSVPAAPQIPGNYGYLGNGEPFGPSSVPGRAGADYPNYSEIPYTKFNCREFKMPGFYADMDTGCQIFHTCDMDMRRHSFMCPNGTIFNQEFFTCDWWYNVKCDDAKNFFELNAALFKDPPKIDNEEKKNRSI
ncbi:uncharacterized protein [Centruroides vittatus]|uniref:uncharacterized protein n=1 Tax=Centruroides vittatus TaxID=120091 RepID=UPI00350F9C3D